MGNVATQEGQTDSFEFVYCSEKDKVFLLKVLFVLHCCGKVKRILVESNDEKSTKNAIGTLLLLARSTKSENV